jgi:dihydroorotate dehydrogenase
VIYKSIIKPLLFLFSPETAHKLVFTALSAAGRIPGLVNLIRHFSGPISKKEEVVVAGLRFPNAVGLAAGFDKDAHLFRELGAFGFGFVEVGTVTPQPQPGNPRPRLFRLPADHALINRMGFNNEGVVAMSTRLRVNHPNLIIGGNIGKNKVTPNEKAVDDYEKCFRALFELVDYFVVNVSSPNTPGLRELQEKGPLLEILLRLQKLNTELAASTGKSLRPVFLKIAPDLSNDQLDDVIEVIQLSKCSGVIATNTTISREGLKTSRSRVEGIGAGGLSGKPVTSRSTEVISYLHTHSKGSFAIIGVGGIHTPEDALEKIKAGASLIQLYTGFIYEGPTLISKIRRALPTKN